MRNGKRPTRRQRMMMAKCRLNSNNWLVLKNPPGEMHIIHRQTSKKRVIRCSL